VYYPSNYRYRCTRRKYRGSVRSSLVPQLPNAGEDMAGGCEPRTPYAVRRQQLVDSQPRRTRSNCCSSLWTTAVCVCVLRAALACIVSIVACTYPRAYACSAQRGTYTCSTLHGQNVLHPPGRPVASGNVQRQIKGRLGGLCRIAVRQVFLLVW